MYFPHNFLSQFWNATNTNLIANIVGGLLSGFILWVFLERRIRDSASWENKIRVFKNLNGDLNYNLELAASLINSEAEYFSKNEITFDNYRTQGIEDFIYQRPFDFDDKFYKNLRKLLGCIQVDNRFLEQIRNGPYIELNKKKVFKNADAIKKITFSLQVFLIEKEKALHL